MAAGGDPDGTKRLKQAYANFDGNLMQFATKLAADGIVELISDLNGDKGSYRKNQALLGIWLSAVPLTTPATGLASALSKQVAKYGIIVGGKTLKVITFTTLLNVEIFRYSIENSSFIFKNTFQKAAGAGLRVIYTIENVRYLTDVDATVKQGSIELVKDADGNIGWRELVNGMKNTLNKVVLGSEDLSQFAVNFRKTLSAPNHKGNVAVFEYLDNSGNLVKKAFTTVVGVASHSEELAIDFFNSQNIPKVNIKRIYSELEPCELAGHTCKAKLSENFPSSQKSFSYDYPGGVDNTIRSASVKQRYIDLENLLK
ncbi:MAG TPA: nucleic acid/nucleotide deaminase domain-containing protein [Cyclobacteriaceae bacterium]